MKIVIDEIQVQVKKDKEARRQKADEILSTIGKLLGGPILQRKVELSDIRIEVTPEENALLKEFFHSDNRVIRVPQSLVYYEGYTGDIEGTIFPVEYRVREHTPITPFEGTFEGQETCQRHD